MKQHKIVMTRRGGPEVLELVEDKIPEPKPGQVRVKVEVVALAFADILIREGMYPGVPKAPLTPGYQLIGVIDAFGDGVRESQELSKGTHVAALTTIGACAEYLCLPKDEVVPVPEGAAFDQAAILVLNWVTAYQMLHRVAEVTAGQQVLVHGAAGGVGTALVQLARLAGATVYGTASTSKQDAVAASGATPIDYTCSDFVERIAELTDGAGVDIVFDAVGGANLWRSRRCLRSGGVLVSYGFSSGLRNGRKRSGLTAPSTLASVQLMSLIPDGRRAQFYAIQTCKKNHPEWYRHDLTALLDLLLHKNIEPVVARRMPLDQIEQAHQLLGASALTGTIVLMVGTNQTAIPTA